MAIISSALLALTTLTVTPTVTFTSDSVYTNTNILTISVKENYDEEHTLISKDLYFTYNTVLGYEIYDNKDTDYIDGLKVDGEYVTNWEYLNYDDTTAHTIYIKTTYMSGFLGAYAAAKDGDRSRILSEPLVLFGSIYFIIATIAIITATAVTCKYRKYKAKTTDEIAEEIKSQTEKYLDQVKNTVEASTIDLEKMAMTYVEKTIQPMLKDFQDQNQNILEALILTRSGDTQSTLALIELLKQSSKKDITRYSQIVKDAVLQEAKKVTELKTQSKNIIEQIIEEPSIVPDETVKVIKI